MSGMPFPGLHVHQLKSFARKLLCLLLLPLAGCMLLDRRYHWQEEALQQDGKSVVIERWMTRGRTGFPDSPAGPVRYQKIRYEPLGVEWESKRGAGEPLSFDIVDGVAYLVVNSTQARARFCEEKASGTYVATFYRWKDGSMQIVDQQQTPVDLMRHNITGTALWRGKQHKEFVSWDDVAYATKQDEFTPLRKFFEVQRGLRCP